MNDLNREKDELLAAVKAPVKRKQPSNMALYAALVFANVVFFALDLASGFTVYWLTNFWIYGVITFFAGFAPLLLHEFLFVRAYASDTQKKTAITGAVLAIISIVGVGVLAAIVNVAGMSIQARYVEIATVVSIVLLAFIHALICVFYFYSDEGIQNDQITAQAIARAIRTGQQIEAGDHILTVTQKAVTNRRIAEKKHGSDAAFAEVLRQLGADDDGDGVPNVIDPDYYRKQKPQQQQFAQESKQERLQDPTHGGNGKN